MQITILLVFAAVVFLAVGYRMKSTPIIGYSLACVLVLATLLFFQNNPNTKVTTPYITLEQQVKSIDTKVNEVATNQQDIAVTQKQLQKVVTTLTKMILADSGGIRPPFRRESDRCSGVNPTGIPVGKRPAFRSNPTDWMM